MEGIALKKKIIQLLRPKLFVRSITDVTPDILDSFQVKGIIIDLDNTLTPWQSEFLAPDNIRWLNTIKSHGFQVCLVSNNKGERIKKIASILDIPFVAKASKPRRRAFLKGMKAIGTKPQETAVIGDQVFTDVLGGNRLGLCTILVDPLSSYEFVGTRLMRIPERAVLNLIRRPNKL
jgi:HAD superfamily phosphatase (TIGR01668 family)